MQKSVKSALRKRNQPIPERVPEPAKSEKTKRKRPVEDGLTKDDAESAAPKRAKLEQAEKATPAVSIVELKDDLHVFKPDNARAKKQYRAKKVRASSPSPARGIIDFDKIPGPVASATKSDKTSTSRMSKTREKDSTKELPAVARVTRSGATKGKENVAGLQESSAKIEVDKAAKAPLQGHEKEAKGKVETKRKPIPKKVKEVKPEPEVKVEETAEEEPSKDEASRILFIIVS